MMKEILLLGLTLALILGACSPAAAPQPSATPAPSPQPSTTSTPSPLASPSKPSPAAEDITIVYHRTGGFAGVDETWTVTGSGTISYQGHMTGLPEQLSASQMAELTTAIQQANFMSLEDSYVPKDTCCDRFLHEITVTLAGKTKTVRTLDSSPTEPPGLTQLLQTLNRLVATPAPVSQ